MKKSPAKKLPQISEAEYQVMKLVWKYAPISTTQITERLLAVTGWSPKTIQTLIKRLVNKGALSYEKQSRVFVYSPLVEEGEYLNQESRSFLDRFYDGRLSSMVCSFLEEDRLSREELDALKSLLLKDTGKGGR